MSEANKRQVGGSHYKTGGTQHWDLFGPEYHMAAATKYVSRWRRKGGAEDLEKALHYAAKLLEVLGDMGPGFAQNPFPDDKRDLVAGWARSAGLSWTEIAVVNLLLHWRDADDIRMAMDGIRSLIEGARPVGQSTTEHVPGTPEDGGHHESLWPWFLTQSYVTEQINSDRWTLMRPFYRVVGSDRNHVLDATVQERNLPRELVGCYRFVGGDSWVIAIEKVPESVRDHYPTLRRELNAVEYSGLPVWQTAFYSQTASADDRYVLQIDAWAAP